MLLATFQEIHLDKDMQILIYQQQQQKKIRCWGHKMTQLVKALGAKPDNLRLVPKNIQ